MKKQPTPEVDEPTAFTAPMPGDELEPRSNQQIIEEMMELKNRREAINNEYASKREAAIQILLAQLEALEYDFEGPPEAEDSEVVDTATFTAKPLTSKSPGRGCGICGVSGHDRRAHRGQARKKPFTSAELARLK